MLEVARMVFHNREKIKKVQRDNQREAEILAILSQAKVWGGIKLN